MDDLSVVVSEVEGFDSSTENSLQSTAISLTALPMDSRLEDAVVQIAIDSLRVDETIIVRRIVPQNVETMARLAGSWPPILVTSEDNAIIDGHHRVQAARQLGFTHLSCTFFTGDRSAAFLEAVRRNTQRGLVLTLAERRQAALRILSFHFEWSDRRIAQYCGLSPHTIGAVRMRFEMDAGGAAEQNAQFTVRIGKDGRAHPSDPRGLRSRIAEVLEGEPHRALRDVARAVGTSVHTVRRVRDEIRPTEERPQTLPVSQTRLHSARGSVVPEAGTSEMPECVSQSAAWSADSAFRSMAAGAPFIEWLTTTDPEPLSSWFVGKVPVSRIYLVADEARRRSTVWKSFAEALEQRLRTP